MLGLVCMLLLLLLKLMRDHGPRVHPDMSPGMRLSHGLLWTATTGEGLLAGDCCRRSSAQPGLQAVVTPGAPSTTPRGSHVTGLGMIWHWDVSNSLGGSDT